MPKELDLSYHHDSPLRTRVRKDAIFVRNHLYDLEGPVAESIKSIVDSAKGLNEAELRSYNEYGEGPYYEVVGWRTPTEKEQIQIDWAFKQDKAKNAKLRESAAEQERKTYEKLKAKFEGEK